MYRMAQLRRSLRQAPLLLALLALVALPAARAQITTADVLGTVTDSSGAVIRGASVTLLNETTHETRTAQSGNSGEYTFNLVPSGHYLITVEADGFKKVTVSHVSISAGDRARIDERLQAGGAQETVQVTAASPALQTDSSTLGVAITEKSVQDLPLNGRNFVQLAQLTPGANEGPSGALSSGSRPDDRRQSSSLSANGQSDSFNTELIDGIDNNERVISTIGVRPSIDSIAEFRVQTNLYTAEVGRTAGAVINIVTRSGSNQFHGTVYEFLRNDVLNARNFFASTGAKPAYKQNQYGASLGGPILRDKTFFFGDYEGYRISQGITSVLTVPTAYEEQNVGDFTDIGGAKIPAVAVNSIAAKYFALYPAPNLSGSVNNYNSTSNRTQDSSTFDVRVDHSFNSQNLFFVRYTMNDVSTDMAGPLPVVDGIAPGGNIANFDGTAKNIAHNAQLNYLHIFNSNLLLELKTAYTRIDNQSLPLNYGQNLSQGFGLPGYNLNLFSSGLAPMYIVGYATLGEDIDLPLHDLDNTFQYNGAVTITRGSHNIKAGAALIRRQATEGINFRPGFFEFAGFTSAPAAAMVNFLEGVPYSVQRLTQLFAPGWRTWEPSAYLQDDWRVTRSLTLNLGLRYDVFTPFTESHNRMSNFDPATGTILVAGQSTGSTAGVNTDYTNLAPRVGFAASLGHGTVLRGGFGLTFFPGNYTSNASLQNAPYVSSYGPVTVGTPQYKGLSAGLPDTLTPQDPSNPSGSLVAVDRNYKSNYLEQFNLNVQKQLGANVMTLGYVGQLGRRLNEPIPNIDAPPPSTASNINLLRPFYAQMPNVTAITYLQSHGVSSYHALQTSFERRLQHGVTINSNYTYARGLNDVQNTSAGSGGAYALLPNQIRSYDYGNSDLDQRHRFVFMATYQLPFGASMRGWKKTAIQGWQVNAIDVWGTGLPFTVFNSVPEINTGVSSDRPNRIASGKVSNPNIHEWFDTSAFVPQAKGTAGDSGRNILYGPNQRHFDFSLFKEFSATERIRVQFRTEAFNLTNTPSYAAPSNSINTAGAGTISATSLDPREFQFALKLIF